MRLTGYANDQIKRRSTGKRRSHRPRLGMGVKTFRQKVARADVEEEAGEGREREGEFSGGWLDEKADGRAQNRCDRVDPKPAQGGALRTAVLQHEADRVHAVGAIMREDRDCDRDADALRRLKPDPEREAIHQAVRRETARSRPAAFFARRVVTTQEKKLVDDDIDEEADRGRDQERLRRILRAAQMQGFGKKVEEGERDHRSRAESEDQVKPVLEAECGESAQKGGAEGAEGDRQNNEGVDDRAPGRIAPPWLGFCRVPRHPVAGQSRSTTTL